MKSFYKFQIFWDFFYFEAFFLKTNTPTIVDYRHIIASLDMDD